MTFVKSSLVLVLCSIVLSGCGGDDDDTPAAAGSDNFSAVSRAAYAQPENAIPVTLNGRDIVNDVSSTSDFDDLISSGAQ